MKEKIFHFLHKLDISAALTILGVIFLFSFAVIITLIAPHYIDPTWTAPSSPYQAQMYEIADPSFYISSHGSGGHKLQFVHHLKKGFSLLAFKESGSLKILAPKDLEGYITKKDDPELKLTSRLLLLRNPQYQEDVLTLELYEPLGMDAFSAANTEGVLEGWVDQNFVLLDEPKANYHKEKGVIYIENPIEFRYLSFKEGEKLFWKYDPKGKTPMDLDELLSEPLSFTSRKTLIEEGEHLFAIEGCWYCHTDQTRTLVQDVVLNGSDSYPAPPSTPNEYIYQQITFPGTKRNGPDLSRVGVKRPNRDWHKAHFWSPKTASIGSIMPAFRHLFDFDPRGTSPLKPGVPNRRFEALFQYLMTKGTRITPPTQAWWLGKDPINTKAIIEGRK